MSQDTNDGSKNVCVRKIWMRKTVTDEGDMLQKDGERNRRNIQSGTLQILSLQIICSFFSLRSNIPYVFFPSSFRFPSIVQINGTVIIYPYIKSLLFELYVMRSVIFLDQLLFIYYYYFRFKFLYDQVKGTTVV